MLHGEGGRPQPKDARGVLPASPQAVPQAANYRHPYYWAPFILMGNWQ